MIGFLEKEDIRETNGLLLVVGIKGDIKSLEQNL